MRRDVNVKSRAATSSIAQKKGSEIKYMTTTEISPVYERDEQFERAYIIAYARGLLEREAGGIMNEEGYITAQRLRDELILAVGRAQPQSRLRPWNLADAAMEVIIDRVAVDLAGEGQGNGRTKYRR